MKTINLVTVTFITAISFGSLADAQCGISTAGRTLTILPRPQNKIKCLEVNHSLVPGITIGNPRKFYALQCEVDRLMLKYQNAPNRFKQREYARKLKKLRSAVASATYACNHRVPSKNPNSTPIPKNSPNASPKRYTCTASGHYKECIPVYGPGIIKIPICYELPAFGMASASTLEEAKREAINNCLSWDHHANCKIDKCY